MRRALKLALWGGLAFTLAVGTAPAQQLSEVIRGAVNNVPMDMFGCGFSGSEPCGLSYRMYAAADPSDINGSANPADGIPSYRTIAQRYLSDPQTTANFPQGSGAGPGNEWYIVWDGITGGGTTDHAGWYGAQSQVIEFFEIGNSLTFNCQPVIAQEACFQALDPVNAFSDTVRADGSALNHVGGISPIPCPTLTENGLSTISYAWEEATNSVSTDGASSAVAGYGLYLLPNPLAAATNMDLAAGAVRVATLPVGTTMAVLDRATLSATPGLEGSTIYSAAVKVDYAGGLESAHFSCNSALSGAATLGPEETGDAPADIDVEQAFVETRIDEFGVEYVVITLDLVDDTVSKNLARYELFFDTDLDGVQEEEIDIRAFPASASRNKAGVPVLFKFQASFDAGDLEGLSSFDDVNGRLQVVIDADRLAASLGTNTAFVFGDFFVRSSRDRFEIGLISF